MEELSQSQRSCDFTGFGRKMSSPDDKANSVSILTLSPVILRFCLLNFLKVRFLVLSKNK